MPEPVSVVITCFNLDAYILQSLRSVRAQDFEGEIEIIVVDDCSNDGSVALLREEPGIRLIEKPRNEGVLNATIDGIKAASHDIVMLLDGDDLWYENKVRRVSERFSRDPALAFVTHDLDFIAADGQPLEIGSRVERVFSTVAPAQHAALVQQGILMHRDYVWLGSAFSLRKSISDCERFFDLCEGLPDACNTYQDWTLGYWIASLSDARLSIVPEKLFSYRLHGANHSGDASILEKALRNSTRALNTADAIARIAVCNGVDRATWKAAQARVRFCRYMVSCYAGKRLAAIMYFFGSLGFIAQNSSLSKECARLTLFCVLPKHSANRLIRSLVAARTGMGQA